MGKKMFHSALQLKHWGLPFCTAFVPRAVLADLRPSPLFLEGLKHPPPPPRNALEKGEV